jgi:membrane protein
LALILLGALTEQSRNRRRAGALLLRAATSTPLARTANDGEVGSHKTSRNFIVVVANRIASHSLSLVAAGVAFYALLALFPAMGIMVSLYGMIADPSQIAGQIGGFDRILPPEAMKLLTDTLQSLISAGSAKHSIALITSLALSLWSANAATSSILTGLNIAYGRRDERPLVAQYAISLLITLGMIVFAILVIAVLAVVPSVASLAIWNEPLQLFVSVGRWPLLALLILLATSVLYRFGAYRPYPKWRWISWGSVAATLGWLIASALFSFYVAHFGSYDVTYGSLGVVVILLLWFWIGALVLLAGAEVDAELQLRDSANEPPATLLR